MAYHFISKGIEDRIDMVSVVWTWVNDRDLSAAQDIGARAMKGEGTGIIRDNAPDTRCKLRYASIAEFQFSAIGNIHHMSCLGY
jgi:hypothetical protein